MARGPVLGLAGLAAVAALAAGARGQRRVARVGLETANVTCSPIPLPSFTAYWPVALPIRSLPIRSLTFDTTIALVAASATDSESRRVEGKLARTALLGNGLYATGHHEDALSMREAELAMCRRRGGPEESILIAQSNLAISYAKLGRIESALRLRQDVYSGFSKLKGEKHSRSLQAANNYAASLLALKRFEEVESLMRETIPVARRVFGESHEIMLWMRWTYARALYNADGATLDDIREAVTALEDLEQTARRVLGRAHPLTESMEGGLRDARVVLRTREG